MSSPTSPKNERKWGLLAWRDCLLLREQVTCLDFLMVTEGNMVTSSKETKKGEDREERGGRHNKG